MEASTACTYVGAQNNTSNLVKVMTIDLEKAESKDKFSQTKESRSADSMVCSLVEEELKSLKIERVRNEIQTDTTSMRKRLDVSRRR